MESFRRQQRGERIFLKEVEHPWEYGIAQLEGERITGVIEKPREDVGRLAVIGVYMYPADVFDVVRGLEPSARGELEITDVNNHYIERGEMEYEIVEGWWVDAGENHGALLRANIMAARLGGEGVSLE